MKFEKEWFISEFCSEDSIAISSSGVYLHTIYDEDINLHEAFVDNKSIGNFLTQKKAQEMCVKFYDKGLDEFRKYMKGNF